MRSDGKRVKNLKPFFEIIPYIMDKRVDSMNFVKQELEAEPIEDYIRDCRTKGIKMNHLSVLVAAYLRVLSQNPELNRFVINKRIYARNHFCVSFVTLKRDGRAEESEQTVVKLRFALDEDIFTVSEKIHKAIADNREQTFDNNMDRLLRNVMRMPWLVSFVVGLIKFADRQNILPASVIEGSPFHTSLFVTNMASIRTNYIYHHIYEFGTTSIFIALGQPTKNLVMKDGEVVEKKVFPMGVVTDERICSGHCYANCFKQFAKYLKEPALLEQKAEQVVTE